MKNRDKVLIEMGFLDSFLVSVARLQKKFAMPFFIFVIVITVFLGIGIKDVSLQTDLTKEMPQDLPIFKLNDKISDIFGGQDTVILLFKIEDSLDKRAIDDIRHPYVIGSLQVLESLLSKESAVDSVTSPASYFNGKYYATTEDVKAIIDANPSAKMFFSRDYRAVIMYIKADVGSSEDKIEALSEVVEENIGTVPGIPGVKVSLTGNPPMRVTIASLMSHDAVYTLSLAALIILLLLFVVERSFSKGLLVFAPLLIGLIWTLGSLGWLGIPLSIATAGLGAMILGLGVEYGVFMLTRYQEERDKGKNQEESLLVAVPKVGGAIFGSGSTTVIGFVALTLSTLPMMQKLGISLALGIGFTLISAVFVAPVMIVLEENFEYWYTHRKHRELLEKRKKHKMNGLG